MKDFTHRGQLFPVLLLGCLIFIVLIPDSPYFDPIPRRDSSVFLYIGENILNGAVPYKDVWDHKGPVIYYINSLGLILADGSLWGVWIIQYLFLWVAAIFGYQLMFQAFGNIPAVFGSVVWLTHLHGVLDGGNFTEEYALPFQFGALLLFWHSSKNRPYLLGFLIGVAFGISFLLRPNIIGIHIAIILTILALERKAWEKTSLVYKYLSIFFGFAIVLLLAISYFAYQQALPDLLDALFRYNFFHIMGGDQGYFSILSSSENRLSSLVVLGSFAWIIGLYYLVFERKRDKQIRPLLFLLIVALPIESVLTGLSGRSFGHYFVSWLPVLGILSSFFSFWFLREIPPKISTLTKSQVVIARTAISVLLLGASLLPLKIVSPYFMRFTQASIIARGVPRSGFPEGDTEIIDLVLRRTSKDDYLLMWGNELEYNLLSKRQSPSRFAYLYPFYPPGFATVEMANELFRDISQKKPLIIDTSASGQRVPWIDSEKWLAISEMGNLTEFIANNYERIALVGPHRWPVYKYVGN